MNDSSLPEPVKVLIAPDKFKGSLTAGEVAAALAAGLRSVGPGSIACDLLPLADGGDGSVEAAISAGFTRHHHTVVGPTGHPVRAAVAFDGSTAVVEVANTCGLSLLPGGRPEPLAASSRGFGEAIRFALGLGAHRIVLALGGSASTDGGTGMLQALGCNFLDADGRQFHPDGGTLRDIRTVDPSGLPDLDGVELILASDVSNPLTGPDGAAAVFGPQKGAGSAQIWCLDQGLLHLVAKMAEAGVPRAGELAAHPGAGSAGGIGYACLLLGARQVSGADYFLDLLDFDARVQGCDVIITGEGSLDEQTLAGKLPAAVAQRAGSRTVVAVVGRSTLPPFRWPELALASVHTLAERTDADSSKDPALSAELLRSIGRDIGAKLVRQELAAQR
jgi:glycerate kinase